MLSKTPLLLQLVERDPERQLCATHLTLKLVDIIFVLCVVNMSDIVTLYEFLALASLRRYKLSKCASSALRLVSYEGLHFRTLKPFFNFIVQNACPFGPTIDRDNLRPMGSTCTYV
jgi:hypothetical protein